MTPHQQMGLGALMVIGSIVTGYVVSCVVPAKHYPRTAGVLATNAVMAALTFAGVDPAAYIVVWLAIFSIFPIGYAIESDERFKNSN